MVNSQATHWPCAPSGRHTWPGYVIITCAAALLVIYGLGARGHNATEPGLRALVNQGVPVIQPALYGVTSEVLIPITSRAYTPRLVELLAEVRVPFSLKFDPDVTPDRPDLERIAALPNLAGLELPGSQMEQEDICTLLGAPSLTSLYLSDIDLCGMDTALRKTLLSVRYLCLDRSVLGDFEWRSVGTAVNLESLSCEDMNLPPAAWRAIRGLPRLQSLAIGGPHLSEEDIRNLLPKNGVSNLSIHQAALTVGQMEILSRLTSCESLTLKSTLIEDSSLRPLARLVHLRELSVTQTEMCARDISSLGELKHLVTLDLSYSGLDDDALRDVARLGRLRSLRINRCPAISDAGFSALEALTGLQELEISSRRITGQGFAAVLAMPELQSLWVYGVNVGDGAIDRLSELRKLRSLSLYLPRLENSIADVARKMQLIGQIFTLEKLEVSGVPQNEETLSKINHLPMLKSLMVRDSGLRGRDLAGLVGLQNLESLHVGGNAAIDDELIEALSRLPKLKTLSVSSEGISEAGLRALGKRYLMRLPDETIIPGRFYGTVEMPAK